LVGDRWLEAEPNSLENMCLTITKASTRYINKWNDFEFKRRSSELKYIQKKRKPARSISSRPSSENSDGRFVVAIDLNKRPTRKIKGISFEAFNVSGEAFEKDPI